MSVFCYEREKNDTFAAVDTDKYTLSENLYIALSPTGSSQIQGEYRKKGIDIRPKQWYDII